MHTMLPGRHFQKDKAPAPPRTLLRLAGYALIAGLILMGAAAHAAKKHTPRDQSWATYNGGVDGDHYSSLDQINRATVTHLKPAWTLDLQEKGGLQTNPLILGRTLYGYTANQSVIAVDAVTGARRWTFAPEQASGQPARGLSYWTDGKARILFAGALSFLYALDPETGKLVAGFGEGGKLDLRLSVTDPGAVYKQTFVAMTTPGVIYKDLIIVGFRAPETEPAPRGDIRAFDVRTGALRWTFHTIPHPGEPGYETWMPDSWKTSGAANNWPGMAVDQKRGIVYVPTGSAVNDFYGYDRLGDDLYANTLLALDANTGASCGTSKGFTTTSGIVTFPRRLRCSRFARTASR